MPLTPSTAFENWTVAITLKGSELTEAILRGYKDAENRNIQLPLGCVALHTGKFRAVLQMCSAIHHLSLGLPTAHGCPPGAVVGVCFVERSVRLDTLRGQQGCREDCLRAKQVLH